MVTVQPDRHGLNCYCVKICPVAFILKIWYNIRDGNRRFFERALTEIWRINMPGFTKQAIKNSFIKLLNEKPVSQITVKDIVEDCGINRNSFYYHYQDLPSMIEEIILDDADELIRKHPTVDSLEDGLEFAASFVLKNRRAALHLYHSGNRDLFEQYLWKVCEYVVSTYISTAFGDSLIGEKDKGIIIRYYKWCCFGAIIDWLNTGLKDDIQALFYRMGQLKKGMLEEMIRRSILEDADREKY